MNNAVKNHYLPAVAEGERIPRIIHQIYLDGNPPLELQENVGRLKALNPGWEHRLYARADVIDFINEVYGEDALDYFNKICPRYGAAKADLFRYLLMYKVGGVYLDIKSSVSRPLDDVILPGEKYVLAQWRNKTGEPHEGWGISKEAKDFAGGEFQQWHIICVAGHPFMKAVIERVFLNIDRYNPWLHGTGALGVFRLTGPTAYTAAIRPLMPLHAYRLVENETALAFEYTIFKTSSHTRLFKNNYKTLTESIILFGGFRRFLANVYSGARKFKTRASQLFQQGLRTRS